MMKLFEFEQQVWQDIAGDILHFVVVQGLRYGKPATKQLGTVQADMAGGSPLWVVEPAQGVDLTVTAMLPPIVQRDIAVWGNALASVAQTEVLTGQQIVPPEQKAQVALNMFGVDDPGALIDELKANGFEIANLPNQLDQTPAEDEDAVEERLVAAVRTQYRRMKSLREADDDPPEVGQKPPKKEIEKVEPITRDEVDDYFEWFAELPELEDLLAEMGLTLEDVDD